MTALDTMPLSTSAYLSDTQHLTTQQHGAYMLILMTMWRAGGWIRDDEVVLRTITKANNDRWRLIAPVIRPLLIVKDGMLSQKRLLSEVEKQKVLKQKKTRSGYLGGIAKSLKNKESGLAGATLLLEQTVNHSDSQVVEDSVGRQESSAGMGSCKGSKDSQSDSNIESIANLFDSQECPQLNKKSTRPHKLPDTWRLLPKDVLYARQTAGWSNDQIESEFQRFRTNHIGKGTKWLRWDMAWQQWVRNEVTWAKQRQGNGKSGNHKDTRTRDEIIVAGAVRVAERMARERDGRSGDAEIPDRWRPHVNGG